ncbi:MAG: FecR domain-containing protein [Acidovorax sp.]
MSAHPGPQADGPIDAAIVRRASAWMARLWSHDASDADRAACAAWRAAHPDHERAWSRLQAFERQFGAVPPAAHGVLREAPPSSRWPSRRGSLRLIAAAAVCGGAAYGARRTDAWQLALADYAAATGQIRPLELPDGTRLVMDTASAIDLRYTARERRIVLRAGRILVTTAADPRPLRVECPQGTVRALGTRFAVRLQREGARVAVYHGAVEVRAGGAAALRVEAGWQTGFAGDAIEPARPAQEADAAWTRGHLVAERMRVADLVAELARYRRGILRCDDSAAELRVTGVFPLLDTDRALANLAAGVPVQVRYRTRYWASVAAL